MNNVLVLVFSDLRHDARVRRQIAALTPYFSVTAVCFHGEEKADYEVITLRPTRLSLWRKAVSSVLLILRQFSLAHGMLHDYKEQIRTQLKERHFGVVIANDVETLPFACTLWKNSAILFDAHEYAPRHFENKLIWRIFFQRFNTWLCKEYIPKVSAMTTVGRMLALEYTKNFGVRPQVLTNASRYVDIEPSPVLNNKVRLVHHGIGTPSRNLHLMIDMMKQLDDRFSLDMYLLVPTFASRGTRNYIEKLKAMAAGDQRIRIHPPVSGKMLIRTINGYDIGVFLLPPVNFNYENTLPNKLFDFIQARLGIAIGPTPEMAEIVRQYNIGVVSEDFTAEALAKKLSALTPQQILQFKTNSGAAAKEINAENNAVMLKKLIDSLLPINSRPH